MIKVLVAENKAPFTQAQIDFLSDSLPSPELGKARKYRRWQDAQAFLCGRYLLMQGLRQYGYAEYSLVDINYTEYNRPYMAFPLDFNISHSGDYILCAFSDHKVGIDIEAIKPIEMTDFTYCFSADELRKINQAPDKYEAFFKHWAIKEAVIKADGRGLNIPLQTIIISDKIVIDGITWFIHKIEIDPAYQSYLATNAPWQTISVERVSLPDKL